jgi:hypothetical protein
MIRLLSCLMWYSFIVASVALITPAAGTAFATPVTTGLVVELRADAGVTADVNGFVSAWADQSGAANDVAQVTAGSQPTLVSGVTFGSQTFNVIRFDGSDILSRTAALSSLPTNLTGGTIFIVHRITPPTGDQVSMAFGSNNNNRIHTGLQAATSFGTRLRVNGNSASAGTSSLASPAPAADTFYVQSTVWNGSGTDNLFLNLLLPDGTLASANQGDVSSNAAFAASQLHVGALGFATGTGTTFQGDIAELLIYNDDLSATDQSLVFNYLGAKYGVVPEPATWILGVFGAFGFVVFRRIPLRT